MIMALKDLSKIRRVTTIVLLLALVVSAKFISRQYDAGALHTINAEIEKATGRIYLCDRPVDPIASDESEDKSRFVSSKADTVIRVIKHSEVNHLFILLCFSISLAITSSVAYFALVEAKQSCLNITKSIQEKDGKK